MKEGDLGRHCVRKEKGKRKKEKGKRKREKGGNG
jgi:hypothetical protein